MFIKLNFYSSSKASLGQTKRNMNAVMKPIKFSKDVTYQIEMIWVFMSAK